MKWALFAMAVSSVAFGSETMRIAMAQDVAKVVIEGESLRWGEDSDDVDPATAIASDSATVTAFGGKLKLNDVPVMSDALRLRAGRTFDSTVGVNGARVRGDVVVLPGIHGLTVINVLALEEYLAGVLGSEMPKSFPLEALKAQAVAARTYALNKKLEQYGQPFHLGSGVISQVYKGLEVDDPRTREAVEATRGLVLTWQLQPIEAYFHSSCGGRTESGMDALGRDLPYLKPVECPCGSLPTSSWSLDVSSTELKKIGGGKSTVQIDSRTGTGRARKVQVGERSMDAVTFRERLGYMRLKSLDFTVSKGAKDGLHLQGHGFGHGAGLCQWGARTLAEKGWSFEKILTHYYPGTELQTLY